jgi:hypothetical protein
MKKNRRTFYISDNLKRDMELLWSPPKCYEDIVEAIELHDRLMEYDRIKEKEEAKNERI